MYTDMCDPTTDSTLAHTALAAPSNVRRPQVLIGSRLLGVLVAVTFITVTGALALSQAFAPAPAPAQVPTTHSRPAVVAAFAPAPEGSVMAVAQEVGPAVVSVRTDQGLGSGVLYDATGLILTNAHVVAGAQTITIALVDGRDFSGKVVGSDTGFDVAIIGITGESLPTAPLGSSSSLRGQSGDINRPGTLPGGSSRRLLPPQPVPAGVDHGALVGQVDPSGPSAQAGVQSGDVIASFGGIDVYNPDELLARLVLHAPGDQLQLGVVRNGQPLTLTLIVGEAPVQ